MKTPISQEKTVTLTGRIVNDLRRQIEGGILPEGARLASAASLCASYEVSNITARAAVRELIRQGYLESRGRAGVFVKAASEAPPQGAVNREQTIGLVLGVVGHPFHAELLTTVEGACREAGYGLKVVGSERNSALEIGQLKRLSSEVAGLLIDPTPGSHAYSTYGELIEGRKPMVLIARYLDGLDVPTVCSDNEQGGYLMGRHLLSTGCSSICVLQDHGDTAARDRVEGCRRALKEAGKEPIVMVSPVFAETGGYLMTRELLADTALAKRGKPGIFALNQQLARGSMIALREAGRRVPDEIALAGYDDTYAVFFDPPLTTIRQDLAGIGKLAVALLLKQIGGATLPPGRRLHFLESELVVRNSTDAHSNFSVRNYLLNEERGESVAKTKAKGLIAV